MYHYKQCGLDNIYLKNGYQIEDGPHGKGISIHDLDGLYTVIARGIAQKEDRLTPKEFRFLRIELDLSQSMMGHLMEKSDQMIAKWEKNTHRIPLLADKVIRDLYMESINESPVSGMLNMLAELDRSIHEIVLNLNYTNKNHEWIAKAA